MPTGYQPRRPRPSLRLERLEERFVMDGAGFVHTDPDEDPGSIVGVAGIIAVNDFVAAPDAAQQLRIDVLGNDLLPSTTSQLRIKSVSATARGATVAISDDGLRILYTPPAGGATWDSFYYIVEDESGKLGKANVTIGDKYAPNREQVVDTSDDRFSVLEDSGETNLDVLQNDGSFAGGEIVAVTTPSHEGSVRIADDGKSLVYQPQAGKSGYEQFRYTVRRQDGELAEANVLVDIEKPFQAMSDFDFRLNVDSAPTDLNVLANDQRLGPTPENPRITAVTQPPLGAIAISDDGQRITFTPAPGYIGSFTFTYTVRYGPADYQQSSATAYVRVENTFLAVDDWIAVDLGSENQSLDVLRNDPILRRYQMPDVTLRIIEVGAGSHGGSVAIDPTTGALHYTPAAGFVGDETFAYTVEDSTGHRDSAMVTVHVGQRSAGALPRFTLPGELEQFLIDQAVARYKSQFGVTYPWTPESIFGTIYLSDMRAMSNDAVAATGYSKTNTQEAGVDEADIVETDGRYLFTFTGGKLAIVDLGDPANPKLVSLTTLSDRFEEMYLQGSRLTLIARGAPWGDSKAVVATFDISRPKKPDLVERTEIDGYIVDSRAVGSRVHVAVMGLKLPEVQQLSIQPDDPDDPVTLRRTETLDEYVARVRATLITSSLPSYRTYGGNGQIVRQGLLVAAADIHKPFDAADDSLLALVTFDVAAGVPGPDATTGIFTAAGSEVYMSGSAFYVLRNNGGDTGIFKFSIGDDGAPALAAVGKVDGLLLNQFSVDEHDGRLRIATTSTVEEMFQDGTWRRELRRANNLFVLEQVGADLVIVGRVENLAPTETIKSVRFLDDRAYVVTFRVVDPLFAVDLGDPSNPIVSGAIKIPGFSDYLHPVGENYVIGIGRDADEITGALGLPQISLFYVGDLAHPTLVDQVTMEGAQWASSEAWNDHHAVAYFAESQLLTIPVSWSETIGVDDDGDGHADRDEWRSRSSIFAFGIEVDQAGGGAIEISGQIEHDGEARRSVRIGDALITVSGNTVKIHDIDNVAHQLGELYIGALPVNDNLTVEEDSGATTIDVLENDHPGVNGAAPRIVAVTQPVVGGYWRWGQSNSLESPGAVEIAEDGQSLIFTPAANFHGTVTLTYTVRDALHGDEEATVTITVSSVDDDPEAVADEFHVDLDSGTTALDVLANDRNPDYQAWPTVGIFNPIYSIDTPMMREAMVFGAAIDLIDAGFGHVAELAPFENYRGLTITAVGAGNHGGVLAIAEGGGAVTYQPAAGFVGDEVFTYTITTPSGRTALGTVTVHVGAPAPETTPVAPLLAPAPDVEPAPVSEVAPEAAPAPPVSSAPKSTRTAYRPSQAATITSLSLASAPSTSARLIRPNSRNDFQSAPASQRDAAPSSALPLIGSATSRLTDRDSALVDVAESSVRFDATLETLVAAELGGA